MPLGQRLRARIGREQGISRAPFTRNLCGTQFAFRGTLAPIRHTLNCSISSVSTLPSSTRSNSAQPTWEQDPTEWTVLVLWLDAGVTCPPSDFQSPWPVVACQPSPDSGKLGPAMGRQNFPCRAPVEQRPEPPKRCPAQISTRAGLVVPSGERSTEGAKEAWAFGKCITTDAASRELVACAVAMARLALVETGAGEGRMGPRGSAWSWVTGAAGFRGRLAGFIARRGRAGPALVRP